jgi:hypothetical protein
VTLRSCLGALCGLSRFIAIFYFNRCEASDCDSRQGTFNQATMSSILFLPEFGVKTLARCSANRIDFLAG